jgi:hypothetical protein
MSKFNKYLPMVPEVTQFVGLSMSIGGVWVLAGFGWALLAAGIVTTAIGAGKEAGFI